MCLILFAYKAHPRYQLILAANRDEFYSRPTAAAEFWSDAPQILAGRDLTAGGTWLGITESGRFAAVTNYRDSSAPSGKKTRGSLTKDFLIGSELPENYLRWIEKVKNDYSGFNLLAGNFGREEVQNELYYFSNRGEKPEKLSAGIYGVSNALLNTNWHKVETGKTKFAKILRDSEEIRAEQLFEILADRRFAPEEKLPRTGVGVEKERVLSAAFIETENYGTTLSTVLLIDKTGAINFTEKTFVGAAGMANYQFSIEK